jgi:cysteine desulfurase
MRKSVVIYFKNCKGGAMKNVYLDFNATTPPAPEVVDIMTFVLKTHFANPSSTHTPGVEVRHLINTARQQIASLLFAQPEELTFTSGGTEADNLAILGVAGILPDERKHLITSQIEHQAVLQSFKYLEKKGFSVTYIAPDSDGVIQVSEIQKHLTPQTGLVSIMLANNYIQDISPLFELDLLEYADLAGNDIDNDQLQTLIELGVTVNY